MTPSILNQLSIVVVSHKLCWRAEHARDEYVTDGGFPVQMQAISELFRNTKILVPCSDSAHGRGVSKLNGKDITVTPLSELKGTGLRRKFRVLQWIVRNGSVIWREIRKADAVHAPIPGDIGTIGMMFALIQRKPLFVRHCGNWLIQRTLAECFWKWCMEFFAGGRNVMLVTGGAADPPSRTNGKIKWVFSTSLRESEMRNRHPKTLSAGRDPRLIIVCRQEPRKGTDIVIESLSDVIRNFPGASLDVVGDGSMIQELHERVARLTLQSNVRFYGKVPQSEVVGLLDKADIFCYPTSASEGFPKVVLEALAVGLPVITTNVSVLPRLLANGCGVLLPAPTPSAVADAIKSVYSNSESYKEMSLRAIETARAYTLEGWRDYIGLCLCDAWEIGPMSPTRLMDRKIRAKQRLERGS